MHSPPQQQSGFIPIPRYLYIITYNTNTLTFRAETTPWFLHRAHLGVRWYRSDARCKKNAGDSPPRAGCCDMRAAVMSTPLGKLIVTVGGYSNTTTPGRRRRVSRARPGAATGLAPPRSAANPAPPARVYLFLQYTLQLFHGGSTHTHTHTVNIILYIIIIIVLLYIYISYYIYTQYNIAFVCILAEQ